MRALIAIKIDYTDIEFDDSGNVISKTPKTILLDSIEDVQVDESSQLTTHPIVTGDMVADHMIKEPCSMTISGELSINGSDNINFDGFKPTLKACQETFGKIKNNAYMCSITKLAMNTNEVRFLQRENMVLTSIQWTERVNSLAFALTFTQALVTNVQEYEVDMQDENLPAVIEPATLSFSSTLMDWDQVDRLVIDTCATEGLTTDEFMTMLKSTGTSFLIGGTAVGAAVLITYIAACASVPVAGWVVGVASLAVAGVAIIGYGIYSAIKSAVNSRKYRINQFKKYKNDKKNRQEVERFANFIGDIHNQLMKLNDAFYVYQISSNEPQECMLSISDEYYIFAFEKDNVNNKWTVNVTMPARDDSVVAANKSIDCAKTSYADCNSGNALFRASGSGAYVYLVYVRDEDLAADDLRNYYVLVSGMKPEDFTNAVTEIIKNAILY